MFLLGREIFVRWSATTVQLKDIQIKRMVNPYNQMESEATT
jgi:hypothetical protein